MRKERLLLFTLALIQFTHIMDFMIMMPLGPQLMRLFNITPSQFGVIVSSYTFSAGVFGFLGAFFVDKFDRKKVLFVAYMGFVLGTFACAFAPSYGMLVFARIFTGMFGGIIGSQILSIIGDAVPNERRATAMGTVMAAFSVASVFGVPFGLFMANKFSWHAPFIIIGCLGIAVLVIQYFAIPNLTIHLNRQKQDGQTPFTFLVNIFRNKNQRSALMLMSLLMLGQFSVIPFISPYMVANVGFTENDLTYIYLCGGAFSIISSPLVGKAADKFGRYKIFTIFVMISIIPLIGITNMPRVIMPVALIATTLFFICAGGRMIPASAMITSTVLPQHRGGFMSINSSVQQISAGIAASISSSIVYKTSGGLIMNYNLVGFFAVVCSIIAIYVGSKIRQVD